jgi:hypothetical protein
MARVPGEGEVRMAIRSAGPPHTAGALTYPEVARRVVAAVAPAELELFAEVTAAWRAGDLARRETGQWLAGSIGFGLDPDLTSFVIYPVLTGAFSQVIGGVAVTGWQRLRGRLRPGRRRRGQPAAPELPPITPELAERVRAACVERAEAAGVPRRRAELIADAVYAALLRGPAADE